MMRLAALPVVLSLVGCASAPPATVAPQPASPTMAVRAPDLYSRIPAEIGAFKLTERTIVRGLPSDSLFRFRDSSRTILSVIIYDVASDVKVGADSQKWTPREGEKFKLVQDIRVNRGQLAAYQLAYSDTARFTAGEHQVLEHSIAIPVRFPTGAIAVEMQYLYLIGGKFVKVRATIPQQGWERTQVPSFARSLALRLAGGT